MHLSRTLTLSALLAACVSVSGGCSTFSFLPKHYVHATPQNPACELVCLWQPAKGTGANGLPARGVAGRLMFFNRKDSTPVIVDGDVRIYLFDNQGTPEEMARPIHQFDFRAADWQNFLQITTLGPAYNVFIPYVKGGHQQVECTLQVRLTPPEGGQPLYSDMTSVTLPGTIENRPDAADEPPGGLASALNEVNLINTRRTADAAAAAAAVASNGGVNAAGMAPNPSAAIPRDATGRPMARSADARTADPRTARALAAAPGQAPAAAGSNVVPASHTVPAEPNAADDRVNRLEQMMIQLMEDRAGKPRGESTSAANASNGGAAGMASAATVGVDPAVGEESAGTARRFKLRRSEPGVGVSNNHPLASDPSDAGDGSPSEEAIPATSMPETATERGMPARFHAADRAGGTETPDEVEADAAPQSSVRRTAADRKVTQSELELGNWRADR